MSYCVTKTTTNGYRCSCCKDQWESTNWYDDLGDALEEVPLIPSGAEFEVISVKVRNGATGKVVAWAKEEWTTGFGQYSGYEATRWYGHRPDHGNFEHIGGKKELIEGRT